MVYVIMLLQSRFPIVFRSNTPKQSFTIIRCNTYISVTRHTSRVTRYTSRVAHYTIHVTRHTLHATRHASHATQHKGCHAPHATRHASCVTRHTPFVMCHTPHVMRHATRHTPHNIYPLYQVPQQKCNSLVCVLITEITYLIKARNSIL